jgi:hypothetical protein
MKPTNQETACKLEKAIIDGNGRKRVARKSAGELAAIGDDKQLIENVLVKKPFTCGGLIANGRR